MYKVQRGCQDMPMFYDESPWLSTASEIARLAWRRMPWQQRPATGFLGVKDAILFLEERGWKIELC